MNGISRRQFMGLAAAAFVGVSGITSAYLYLNDESETLTVEQVTLPIPNLHPALAGFTIVQLSDIHLIPYTKPPFVAEVVAAANALNPDVTVLTGDYVWHEVEAMFELAPIIANLNARYGVFSVLGNHDLWTDVNVIKTGLREARIPLLVNQGIPISVGEGTLWLAGLDDGWAGSPDLDASLEGMPTEATAVALYHEPDLADDVAADGRVHLQLAGHSHGGQVRFEKTGALILPYLARKYDYGLYRVGEMWLYTNRGIGATSIPIRVNCPPEITEITLARL
ncbi:MAG: metallophosphoesterase [Chloroflexi bacterium]|nr:metallophosphoesterase [Chloroflexota bacterium]